MFVNRVLRLVSQSPKLCHVGMLGAVMEALQTINLVWHLPFSGHSDFVLQLRCILSVLVVVGFVSLSL